MYPDKKVEITDMDTNDEILEEPEVSLDFDIDELIKKIDAKKAELEAKSEAEKESEDTIEFTLSEDEELP